MVDEEDNSMEYVSDLTNFSKKISIIVIIKRIWDIDGFFNF
jgi:hypothetical protein